MGLTRWILALCGYVRLEVCGAHPERVLNACADAGIACTASEPVDAYTLRFTVREHCADTAAALARLKDSPFFTARKITMSAM